MSTRAPRLRARRGITVLLGVLLATTVASCATGRASRHASSPFRYPTSSSGDPSPLWSVVTSSGPLMLTTPPPPTWPPNGTATPSGYPPTLYLTDADGTKTYVVPVGTMIDVTVTLRSGDGVSISPPSSANETILETVSSDRAAAVTTHALFQAVAVGDSGIIVGENPDPHLCPGSRCAGTPRGFDFYITVVAANG